MRNKNIYICIVFFTRLKNKKYKTLVLQLTALTGKTFCRWKMGEGRTEFEMPCCIFSFHLEDELARAILLSLFDLID